MPASHFHYSREYLSRLFRQYYNINISEYITRQKISAAKKALESGSRVTEAFQLSGYHTMSSFISAFKKFVNMTPSEYRKRISDRTALITSMLLLWFLHVDEDFHCLLSVGINVLICREIVSKREVAAHQRFQLYRAGINK
jgi:AraC-like DNA-binding protein